MWPCLMHAGKRKECERDHVSFPDLAFATEESAIKDSLLNVTSRHDFADCFMLILQSRYKAFYLQIFHVKVGAVLGYKIMYILHRIVADCRCIDFCCMLCL